MQSKLPSAGTTIFSVMSALAREYQAINLSQGFPDFPVSETLIQAVFEAMRMGFNQYAPMPGIPELREALSEKISSLYQVSCDPETEITITPGATYGVYTALATLLFPGDEAIVLEPAYDSYIPNIESLGARAVCVPLSFPDYSVDWNKVEEAITPRTKVLIINTPHNPSGSVFQSRDIEALRHLMQKYPFYVVSDEVYEHLVFDEHKHDSILKYPDLFSRSLVVFSFGKVFHATGWKLGYVVAPADIMTEFRKLHQYLSFSCNTPMQVALSQYLQTESHYLELSSFYQVKRDYFLEQIRDLPFTMHQPAAGSYFQLLGYDRMRTLPDREFAEWLTREVGVAVIPVSAFYQEGTDHHVVRFCFAKKKETIDAAIEKLHQWQK